MKAGILTFHNAHNYGAALQVLASQTWLARKGYDCEVINYRINKIDRSYEEKYPNIYQGVSSQGEMGKSFVVKGLAITLPTSVISLAILQ